MVQSRSGRHSPSSAQMAETALAEGAVESLIARLQFALPRSLVRLFARRLPLKSIRMQLICPIRQSIPTLVIGPWTLVIFLLPLPLRHQPIRLHVDAADSGTEQLDVRRILLGDFEI